MSEDQIHLVSLLANSVAKNIDVFSICEMYAA